MGRNARVRQVHANDVWIPDAKLQRGPFAKPFRVDADGLSRLIDISLRE
jgi:hypothetical protein